MVVGFVKGKCFAQAAGLAVRAVTLASAGRFTGFNRFYIKDLQYLGVGAQGGVFGLPRITRILGSLPLTDNIITTKYTKWDCFASGIHWLQPVVSPVLTGFISRTYSI